jgi:ferritin-like metal-binding protein YciE
MKIDTLEALFINELADMYNGEQQITKALPKMAEKATDPRLAEGFETHLKETQGQIERIERIVALLDIKLENEKCEAMEGLLKEGDQMMKTVEQGPLLDAAMITAAQKVEHYEIAAYGSLCALAEEMGWDEVVTILHDTLDEEKATDGKLQQLAEGNINHEAHELRAAA